MLRKLSIRTKFLFCLLLIPLLALGIFLQTAISIFEEDKIAYIFESSLTLSKATSPQVRASIESLLTETTHLLSNFDGTALTSEGEELFLSYDRLIELRLYTLNDGVVTPLFMRQREANQSTAEPKNFEEDALYATEVGVLIRPVEQNGRMRIFQTFQDADGKSLVAALLIQDNRLNERFNSSESQKLLLVDSSGLTLLPNDRESADLARVIFSRPLAKSLLTNSSGVEQVEIDKQSSLLASYSDVGLGNLKVISTVDRAVAKSAIALLVRKTALTFLFIILLTILFSIFTSRALTTTIRHLTEATRQIAKGDFNVTVWVESEDEIGSLARGFTKMASEVSRLIAETAEKSRMQSELVMAKKVQEMLFAPSEARLGPIDIAGFYEPASECSGDWWYYFEDDRFVYLWIGDATGHGVHAALLTSAARSAVAAIHQRIHIEPADGLAMLNSSLYQTSKGTMMMTFCLARIEKQTGTLIYSNASHEPTLLLRAQRDFSRKEQFIYLDANNNPRLGELERCVYSQTTIKMDPGDKLFLYTDGVYDIRNPKGKEIGFRRMKDLLEVDATLSSKDSLSGITQSLMSWRASAKLNDDVTIAVVTFNQTVKERLSLAG